MPLIAIRDGHDGDKNFILATWLRGLYYGSDFFRAINKDVFMKNYHAFLERTLTAPYTRVKVACLKDDPEVIIGYLVTNKSGDTAHWAFVKSNWRKSGVAARLADGKLIKCTHLTAAGNFIKLKHNLEFNPFLIGQ